MAFMSGDSKFCSRRKFFSSRHKFFSGFLLTLARGECNLRASVFRFFEFG